MHDDIEWHLHRSKTKTKGSLPNTKGLAWLGMHPIEGGRKNKHSTSETAMIGNTSRVST